MWLFIWGVLSLTVMGVFVWSLLILRQQKQAWSAFAVKNGLTYQPGKMTESPVVQGQLDGCLIAFYTDARPTPDARGQRQVTVIEVEMGPGMKLSGAMATRGYAGLIAPLKMTETYVPPGPAWDNFYIVKGKSAADLKDYLTPERAGIIHSLFSMKNDAALIAFDPLDFVIRMETRDPIRDAVRMEKIARRLIDAAKKLGPQPAS